jgi:hypothetical protein
MFYVKEKINGTTTRIDLTDENIFTICPECKKEHQINIVDVLRDGDSDLYSTSVLCVECSKKE